MISVPAPVRPFIVMIAFVVPVWVSIERNRIRDQERREAVQKEAVRKQVEAAVAWERVFRRNAYNQRFELKLEVDPFGSAADDGAATP